MFLNKSEHKKKEIFQYYIPFQICIYIFLNIQKNIYVETNKKVGYVSPY